jgi:hypothetical protein
MSTTARTSASDLRKPPAPTALHEPPVPGPACVFIITLDGHEGTNYGCSLLGPGRDHLTHDDAVAAARSFVAPVSCTVSKVYDTIAALVADYPGAYLDGTARRLLAAERAQDEYDEAVAAWRARLEAAGLEPCDRCGGVGGWRGWPGYTCYRCKGAGVDPKYGPKAGR